MDVDMVYTELVVLDVIYKFAVEVLLILGHLGFELLLFLNFKIKKKILDEDMWYI